MTLRPLLPRRTGRRSSPRPRPSAGAAPWRLRDNQRAWQVRSQSLARTGRRCATAARSRAGIASTEDRIHATSGEMASVLVLAVGSGGTGRATGSGHANVASPRLDSWVPEEAASPARGNRARRRLSGGMAFARRLLQGHKYIPEIIVCAYTRGVILRPAGTSTSISPVTPGHRIS